MRGATLVRDEPRTSPQAAVLAEQVAMLYSFSPYSTGATAIAALIVGFVSTPYVPIEKNVAWVAGICLLSLARYVLVRLYRRAAPTPAEAPVWLTAFVVGSFLAGTFWT